MKNNFTITNQVCLKSNIPRRVCYCQEHFYAVKWKGSNTISFKHTDEYGITTTYGKYYIKDNEYTYIDTFGMYSDADKKIRKFINFMISFNNKFGKTIIPNANTEDDNIDFIIVDYGHGYNWLSIRAVIADYGVAFIAKDNSGEHLVGEYDAHKDNYTEHNEYIEDIVYFVLPKISNFLNFIRAVAYIK